MNQPAQIEYPKVALMMIVKDDTEAESLERCLKSARHLFDGLYITGTNKPDEKIQEIVKKYEGEYSFFQWIHDFAAARNFNLSQVPKDKFEFTFWLDADDYLSTGVKDDDYIRKLAQESKLNNISALFLPYWYQVDLDSNGNVREVVIEHLRERLVKHDGSYKWVGALHETMIEQRKDNIVKTRGADPIIVHLSNPERMEDNLNRNIKILETTVEREQHKDPRTVVYLAKAYFDRGKFKQGDERHLEFELARALFNEYLNGSGEIWKDYKEGSGWEEERGHAWAYIGDMARLEGKVNESIIAGLNAIQEAPQFPNFYLDLAMSYASRNEWEKAETWLKLFTAIPIPQTTMIINRRDLKSRALELDMQIGLAKNQLDRAVRSSAELVKVLPHIPQIVQRHEQVMMTDEYNKALQSIMYLVLHLEKNGHTDKIIPLIESIPVNMASEQVITQLRQKYLPARVWDKNEVAIFCGPGFEQWSPESLNRNGMGGSEEAVVRLGQELSKIGYKVTVYANPGVERGTHEGVEYKMWYELNGKDTFNIVVLWRGIGFVDMNLNARQTYLWMHDIPNNPDYLEARVNKFNKIFALSNYHKSLLRMNKDGEFVELPEDKVVVSANGIISEEGPSVERNTHRMIWTSSYDRGLPYLLKIWPDILAEVPDAKLEICYGWNVFDAIFKDNPARQGWKAKVSKAMNQEGITHHGRVGQDKIVELTKQSGVWAYPTDFQEISCISAMKAQAWGAIPVVTDYAALKETVKYGKKVPVDITTEEGQEEYKKALIETLKDVEGQKTIRPEMMSWAKENFPWSKVATQWDEIFKQEAEKSTISLV